MENFSKLSNQILLTELSKVSEWPLVTRRKRWLKIQGSFWGNCRDSLKLTSHVIWFNPQKRQLHMVQGLSNDPVLNAIENFSDHISVFKIVEARNVLIVFLLNHLLRKISDASKASQSDDLPKLSKIIPTFSLNFFKQT